MHAAKLRRALEHRVVGRERLGVPAQPGGRARAGGRIRVGCESQVARARHEGGVGQEEHGYFRSGSTLAGTGSAYIARMKRYCRTDPALTAGAACCLRAAVRHSGHLRVDDAGAIRVNGTSSNGQRPLELGRRCRAIRAALRRVPRASAPSAVDKVAVSAHVARRPPTWFSRGCLRRRSPSLGHYEGHLRVDHGREDGQPSRWPAAEVQASEIGEGVRSGWAAPEPRDDNTCSLPSGVSRSTYPDQLADLPGRRFP